MFKKPFSFEGRIRRTEYGLSYLIYAIISIVLSILEETVEGFNIIYLLVWVPLLFFMIAQGAKRCHDRGNSGWYQIIPFYGLWMLFGDSDFGPNAYGDNPKGKGNHGHIDEIGQFTE
jgi:uncharacterized membrane protein YhaH (DUF805 family)